MRIVISNPDSLGDVMLREPLFAAVHEAGHELLLVVRDFVAPLAKDIAPYAELAVCVGNPYLPNFGLDSPLLLEMKKQVERFSADLLVVASYQYTQLEEQLAVCLPGIDIIGFSGHLFQPQPNVVLPSTIAFSSQVQVSLETPESTKNELLCGAILGRRVSLRAPRLKPTAAGRKLAANHLRKLGLKNTPFWCVCAGDRPPLGLKNWEPGKWIELCRTLIEQHNIRILFIGTPEEHESTKAIQEGLGLAARHTASITGEPMTIGELAGLLDGAEGYIGKDTGPMHLAAALGKPVVAVFGGGHWPRFVPLARTGAVFSVDVKCKGCDWRCPLQRSFCVKDIPVAPVLRAVEDLINGKEDPFSIALLPLDELTEAEMFRGMYDKAQSINQLLDTERATFKQWHGDRVRDIDGLTSMIEDGRRESAAEIASRDRAIAETNQRIQRQETEIAIFTGAARDLREERGDLTRQLAESRFQIDKLESRVTVLDMGSDKLIEERGQLQARLESLEQTETGLRAQLAKTEAGKDGAEHALQSLELELTGKLLKLTRLQTHLDTIESRHLGRIADLEKSLAQQKRENQLAFAVIPELRTELAAAQREVNELGARLLVVEREITEIATKIRAAGGALAASMDWREGLAFIEADRARRLAVIEELSELLRTVEEDRANRGEQIEILHRHIAGMTAEMETLQGRVPYRAMRALRIL